MPSLILLGSLPWFLLTLYYANKPCEPVFGACSAAAYLEKNVRLYPEMKALDKVMPPDGVIYSVESHWASFYFPRMIYYHRQDCPKGRELYWLRVREESVPLGMELVYENKQALLSAHYSGYGPQEYGSLQLYRVNSPQ